MCVRRPVVLVAISLVPPFAFLLFRGDEREKHLWLFLYFLCFVCLPGLPLVHSVLRLYILVVARAPLVLKV